MKAYIRLKTEVGLSEAEKHIVNLLRDAGFVDISEVSEIQEFKYYVEESINSNPALGSILGSNVAGSDKVIYDSEVLCGVGLDEAINQWQKILTDKILDADLLDFEFGMRDKIGPTSYRETLLNRMPSIIKYWSDPDYTEGLSDFTSDPDFHEAYRRFISEFKSIKGSIRISDKLHNTLKNMKKSTSSGFPHLVKKSELVSNDCKCVFNISRNLRYDHIYRTKKLHSIYTFEELLKRQDTIRFDDYCSQPAILGWRGQSGGRSISDQKQRVVWMFPHEISVLELHAYQPLIASVQKHNLISGYLGNDEVDNRMTKLFASKEENDYIICTDFSTYDTHLGRRAIDLITWLQKSLLTKGQSQEIWMSKVFPIKYNIPLLISPNIILMGDHGMGSGSGGTNFDETLLHRFLQHYAAVRSGQQLNIYSQCLGDDGIICYKDIDVDSLLETYTSLGLEMQPSKQTVSTEWCVYLKRYYRKDYVINGINRGVYSTMRALGKLYFRERYYDKWTDKDQTLRTLSILENCCWHPLFEEFVDFIYSRNRSLLGLNDDTFNELTKVNVSSSEYVELLSYANQLAASELQQGINDWHVVQLIKKKYLNK